MRTRSSLALGMRWRVARTVAGIVFATSAQAQSWEAPAPLNAREQLGAELVQGPHHEVSAEVQSDGLTNRYVVVSEFQRIEVAGNTLLRERVREQAAIAALREIKTTEAYEQGLLNAAEAPLAVTRQMLSDPKGLVMAAPQAVSNLVSDVRGALGGLRDGVGGGGDLGDTVKQLIGYGKVKGRLAHEFGVDLHSSNEVLQEDLDDVAWAMFAGGASIDLAMSQAPMAASMSARAVKTLDAAVSPVWTVPPATLLSVTAKAFEAMGLPDEQARALARSEACTITHQTRLAATLATLEGVAGRDAFAAHAAGAASEAACRGHGEVARLLRAYHTKRASIDRVELVDGVVTFIDSAGRRGLPLRADYLFWTAAAGARADALGDSGQRVVWSSGRVSSRARSALQQRGIALEERVFSRYADDVDVAEVLVPNRNDEENAAASD